MSYIERTISTPQTRRLIIYTDSVSVDLIVDHRNDILAVLETPNRDDQRVVDAINKATLAVRGGDGVLELHGPYLTASQRAGVQYGNGNFQVNTFSGARGHVTWSTQALTATVRVPLGTDIQFESISGDLNCSDRVGSLHAITDSGDISVHQVESFAKVSTGSGDVTIHRIEAFAKIRTANGDIELGSIQGDADLSSQSGEISVRDLYAGGFVQSLSGDVQLRRTARGNVDLKSISGDILVPRGVGSNVHVRTTSGEVIRY